MENLILSLTNLYAIFPFVQYYQKGLYLKASSITFAAISSFVYHLIETHKHHMPGIGIFNDRVSHHIFLNLDRFFAFFAIYQCFSFKILNYPYHVIFALSMVFISEVISRLTSYEKIIHVITHSLWHISIFEIARLLSI